MTDIYKLIELAAEGKIIVEADGTINVPSEGEDKEELDYWAIHEIERECGMETREVDYSDVTIDELLGAPRKKPVRYV